jgi:hypothetical protein
MSSSSSSTSKSNEKEITSSDVPVYVNKLKCAELRKFARIIGPQPYGIKGASTMTKTELRNAVIKTIHNTKPKDKYVSDFLHLKCSNLVRECDWFDIFKDKIVSEYNEMKEYKNNEYNDTETKDFTVRSEGKTVKKSKSTRYASCDPLAGIRIISFETDEYEFLLDNYIHIFVRPTISVIIAKTEKAGTKSSEIEEVMTEVWRNALYYWIPPDPKKETLVFEKRGTNTVDVVLDSNSNSMDIVFQKESKTAGTKATTVTTKIVLSTGRYSFYKLYQYFLATLIEKLAGAWKHESLPPYDIHEDDSLRLVFLDVNE